MNATDELREMLDKCGIEYEQSCIEGIAEYAHVTKWETQAGNKCTFYEIEDGYPPHFTRMFIETPTAEQAIAATVGRGTCHDVSEPPKDGVFWPSPHFRCSECGATHVSLEYVYYCPNCGRQVSE